MRTGISLYFASGYEANAEVVAKAQAAGCHYAFTSLHIPEEEVRLILLLIFLLLLFQNLAFRSLTNLQSLVLRTCALTLDLMRQRP